MQTENRIIFLDSARRRRVQAAKLIAVVLLPLLVTAGLFFGIGYLIAG